MRKGTMEEEDSEKAGLISKEEYDDAEKEEKPQKGATFALIVLTFINLLNYMDRIIPSATKSLYQVCEENPDNKTVRSGICMDDFQTGVPAATFLLVYMLASPIFAALADRGVSRKLLLILGVVWWSLSTGSVYFAQKFWDFTLYRTLVAVGEACYSTIAPALLSDLFPPSKRNKAMTLFFLATPFGGALGFVLGGFIGKLYGWRYAFLVCGAPGVLVSLLLLFVKDPGMNVYEKKETKNKNDRITWMMAFKALIGNKTYLFSLVGLTFLTFAVGAMAEWLPTFFTRDAHVGEDEAGLIVGAITVIGGIGGTVCGSAAGEKLKNVIKNSYMFVSSISTLLSSVFGLLMLFFVWKGFHIAAAGGMLLLAQFFSWWYMGPINALQANIVSSQMRARTFSITIICMHLFGDGISPMIVGAISDKTNLFVALLLVPAFVLAAGFVWGIGWIVSEDDIEYVELP